MNKGQEVANQFAAGTGWQRTRYDGDEEKPRIIPVFLSIKNPKDFGPEQNLRDFIYQGEIRDEQLTEMAMTADGIDYDDEEAVEEWNNRYSNDADFRAEQNDWIFKNTPQDEMLNTAAYDLASEARSRLEQAGHDGVRYKNQVEGGISWIIFHPNQAKSAIGNSGAFDAGNNSITASTFNAREHLNKLNDKHTNKVLSRNCSAKINPGINQAEGMLIYGTEDGTPVAFARYEDGRVVEVAVLSDYQRQGIGRKLLDALSHMETKGPYTSEGRGLVEKTRGGISDDNSITDAAKTARPSTGGSAVVSRTRLSSSDGHPPSYGLSRIIAEKSDWQWKHEKMAGLKEWFGDSKIVDKDGNPLPVYHGTKDSFEEFTIKPSTRSILFKEYEVHCPFHFFTADEDWAKEFVGSNGKVLSVYLKMERPLDMTTRDGMKKAAFIFNVTAIPIEELINEHQADLDQAEKDLKRAMAQEPKPSTRFVKLDPDGEVVSSSIKEKPGYVWQDFTLEQAREMHEAEITELQEAVYEARLALEKAKSLTFEISTWMALDEADAADKLKAAGYDGVIFEEDDGNISYAVPDANQIKAVNAKEFNPDSKSIMAADAKPIPLSEINAIIREYMPILTPGLPLPEVKVVNNQGSSWLGRDVYRGAVPDNTLIELQKSITYDEESLRRIIAHELCHHDVFLTVYRYMDRTSRKVLYNGHGREWKAVAAKFNARFGADFVTQTSDQNIVVSDTGKEYYLLVWNRGDKGSKAGDLWYAWCVRPSPKQQKYINKLMEDDGFNFRLFKVTDPTFSSRGSKVGEGWSGLRIGESDAAIEKLQKIWDEQTPLPMFKVPKSYEDKMREQQAVLDAFKRYEEGKKKQEPAKEPEPEMSDDDLLNALFEDKPKEAHWLLQPKKAGVLEAKLSGLSRSAKKLVKSKDMAAINIEDIGKPGVISSEEIGHPGFSEELTDAIREDFWSGKDEETIMKERGLTYQEVDETLRPILPDEYGYDWNGCDEVVQVRGLMGGVPVVKQIRFPAGQVADLFKNSGSLTEIFSSHPSLDVKQIKKILEFAFPDKKLPHFEVDWTSCPDLQRDKFDRYLIVKGTDVLPDNIVAAFKEGSSEQRIAEAFRMPVALVHSILDFALPQLGAANEYSIGSSVRPKA